MSLSNCKPIVVVGMMDEIFIQVQLKHDHIVKFYEKFVDSTEENLYLVIEYCDVCILKCKH